MAKVIVRGGSPGMVRLELEGDETSGIEVSSALSVYQGLHEVAAWFQAQLDAALAATPPKFSKSIAPKGDA